MNNEHVDQHINEIEAALIRDDPALASRFRLSTKTTHVEIGSCSRCSSQGFRVTHSSLPRSQQTSLWSERRGAGAIGAALLGSVSASVLRHVDVPTVVVP